MRNYRTQNEAPRGTFFRRDNLLSVTPAVVNQEREIVSIIGGANVISTYNRIRNLTRPEM